MLDMEPSGKRWKPKRIYMDLMEEGIRVAGMSEEAKVDRSLGRAKNRRDDS